MDAGISLSVIAAQAINGVIGVDNRMPWHLPADFRHFKSKTMGKPIIMGRKTWESLPVRPLPGRLNIVVSRQKGIELDGASVHSSLAGAVAAAELFAKKALVDEVMIIGGAELYDLGMDYADRLYLTRIDVEPDGDAYFPEFDQCDWEMVSNDPRQKDGDYPAHSFEVWERK
jgi:dihydrofolate reductase